MSETLMGDGSEEGRQPTIEESEGVYRAIFEQGALGVAQVVSKTGAFVRINRRYAEIVGYTLEELRQLTFQDITHPDDLPKDLEHIQRLLNGDIRDFSVEKRYYHKDGAIVWVNLTVSPMWADGEEPKYHIAVAEDITQRKQAEEALRDSEEKFRQIAEAIREVFWVGASDWEEVYYVSPAYEEIWGRSCQSLYDEPLSWMRAVHADDRELVKAAIAKAVRSKSGDSQFPPYRVVRPDGAVRWILARAYPVRDEGGRVIRVAGIAEDITEYRRAQQDHQTLFREMLNGFALHEIICDEQGSPVDYRFLAVNPAFERLTGLNADDLVGRTVLEVMPNTEKQWIDTYGRVALSGEPVRFEDYSQELEKHYLVTAFRPTPGQFACIFDDFTELKRAEKAIQEARDYAENLIHTANAMVIVLDSTGDIKVFNDTAEKITGYTREELRGKNWFEILVPRERYREVSGEFERLLAGGLPKEIENPILTKDGEERHIVWQNSELVHNGQVDGTVSFGIDITDRKRAEAALRTTEERYRLAQRLSGVGTWEWNVATDHVFWSDEVLAIWGLQSNDFGGTYDEVARRIHPDDLGRWQANVRACLEQGTEHNIDYRIVRPDGTVRWIAAYGDADRDEDGKVLRMIGVIMDVTERKLAQREREELIAKLEAQNAELERFTYTVSHDLKSPLITIKGYIGMLSEDLHALSAEAVKSDLARISKAADKMSVLLEDLLELSRIGRLANPPEDVPFQDLADDALELLSGQIQGKRIQVDIHRNLPVLHGDRTRLLEVLQNLVDNAVKYMGRQLHPRIEIGACRNHEETVCYVRDNGIGIEPRFHDKVFDLFDQLDPKVDGSGIGLALTKRIIEVHGGRIWVESEGDGRGSTFCFTIPAKAEIAESGNTPMQPRR